MTASCNKLKLVVFDVEGVLIPRNRFFFLIGKSLGFIQLIKVFFYGFLYEAGLIPLKTALKHLFNDVRGMNIERILQIGARVPIVPGAETLFNNLKAQGCKTALITSGLPTIVTQLIADRLGADYAFGFEVGLNGDVLTGQIWGDVIERNGKLAVLRKLFRDESVAINSCAVVADDRNNASIFLQDIFKIGFNPDFVLRIKADRIVMGSITKLLPIINREPKPLGIKPSRNDLIRETIHASGFFVTIIAHFVGLIFIVVPTILILALYVISEYLRTIGKKMPIINYVTRKAASKNELYQIVLAPVYYAVGILLALLIFPVPANYATVAIFTLGDSMASLVGEYYGATSLPFNRAKSLEGSLAGFVFAFLAGAVFISPWFALVGAAIAMFIEYLPLPINDNLLIPVFTGLILTLLVR
ncbi:MAG TPA: haloacid dehalogenase-like hydrolase [Candidatus Sulfotelmatobacter sp.]|nr:haloacid dehalogenase-like hydrolase [Candidatus Sulfotelmatobacter sp.]